MSEYIKNAAITQTPCISVQYFHRLYQNMVRKYKFSPNTNTQLNTMFRNIKCILSQ